MYYQTAPCCDIFTTLYDAEGNIIGHPAGGITGRGDGTVPLFLETRKGEVRVWADERTLPLEMTLVLAPIEKVEILILESFPPQYNLAVTSGLPNSCAQFAGYTVDRDGDTVVVSMTNWKPSGATMACAAVYTTVKTTISLGSDFNSGTTYTVAVNNKTKTFVAQ